MIGGILVVEHTVGVLVLNPSNGDFGFELIISVRLLLYAPKEKNREGANVVVVAAKCFLFVNEDLLTAHEKVNELGQDVVLCALFWKSKQRAEISFQ
jgi:hypothetical protein